MSTRFRRRFGVAGTAITACVLLLSGISSSAAAAAPAGSSCTSLTLAQAQARILTDVNAARTAAGVAPLTENPPLSAVATKWSQKQAKAASMSHNPNYSTEIPPGWSRAAENVATGQTVANVTTAWMNSSGHRANILNAAYTHIGIGIGCSAAGRPYYTQNFGAYTRTPGTAAAPQGVKAAAGQESATVSWSTLTYTGTQTLTGFTVTANPGGITATASGSARSIQVAGLTPGTAYTFTVTSTNAFGVSPASTASASVTPTALPVATPTGAPKPAPTPTTPANPADAFAVKAHVQSIGWMDGYGTTGRGLRLEALTLTQRTDLVICARAHVQTVGWMSISCTSGTGTSITLGTTGRALRMEALELWSPGAAIWAEAHVQSVGWQGVRRSSAPGEHITIGTTGRALRMEAVRLWP
ncbi:CAP domain-containing protein [Microbacterium sp. bgisy203]|uniref:CAP domain-containing protein n=1 Tax=Microbacterium sp. bgisy203 TaxID=3413799 RepID=UPI003D7039A9